MRKRGPNIQNVHEVNEKNKNQDGVFKNPLSSGPCNGKIFASASRSHVFYLLEVIIIFRRIYKEIRRIGHFMGSFFPLALRARIFFLKGGYQF